MSKDSNSNQPAPKKELRIVEHSDGSMTFRLNHPYKLVTSEAKLHKVKLAKPTAGTMMASDSTEGDFAKDAKMVADLSGLSMIDIAAMHSADFIPLCKTMSNHLLGKPLMGGGMR